MRRLAAALLLLGASGGAFAQALACNPKTPRADPGAGFIAFGATEQAYARAGQAGPAWEWALGSDTDGTAKVQGNADWISGRSFGWTLTNSGNGSARLVVRDGAATVLALDYPSGMDAGNALELRATISPSVAFDTGIRASLSSLNGKPVAGDLSLVGARGGASQAIYFFFPPMAQGFTAEGSVTLSYGVRPTGSRVGFTIRSGMLPCTNRVPSVSLTSPPAGAIVQAGQPTTVGANAADADGTVSQVEFFANGTSIGVATAPPFSVSSAFQPGAYSIAAVATDNAGDSTASTALPILANAQPTVTLTSPAAGAILQPPGSVTLRADAADADGVVSKVDFYQDGTLVGSAAAAPYSFSVSSLAPGTHTFSAVASDDRGGAATSAPASVVVNAPPTVSVTSPMANAAFKAPADIPLLASAVDSDGAVSSVAFYYGDTLLAALTAAPFAFTWTGVPQGTYTVTARVTDNTGYTTISLPIRVTVAAAEAQLYFIGVDHLNTPRLVMDSSGTVVWRWDQQEPFGNNAPDENPGNVGLFDMPLRFPGQYFDGESRLHYNYFRSYDLSIGRYTTSDPLGLWPGPNTYSYVGNSPINYFDPYGLDRTSLINTSSGRSVADGPTNGNWGGKCWSGGAYSCGDSAGGNAPPTDSADACYMRHDNCYTECGVDTKCIERCDDVLVKELRALADDPRAWPQPPRIGTEPDSRRYRDWAIRYFR